MAVMADTEQPGEVVWVHLNDEYPRLGCGRRRLVVLKTGWKWMKVREANKDPDNPVHRQRIPRDVWDKLKRVVPVNAQTL